MPLDTVVLSDNFRVRPGEVDTPKLPVKVSDLVLQFRHGQSAVDENQPRLTLHWRFGTAVGKQNQFADVDYAASPLLFRDRRSQLCGSAAFNVERGVENTERTWSTEVPCDLNGRPRRCRRKPASYRFQRRTKALMHHEFG